MERTDIKNFEDYDIVIFADSILDLKKNGWTIKLGKDMNVETLKKLMDMKTFIIGVQGLENKGKTWLIAKLCGKNFPYGYHVHTEGKLHFYNKIFYLFKILN